MTGNLKSMRRRNKSNQTDMAIFIPNENIEKNQSIGQAANKAVKEWREPE